MVRVVGVDHLVLRVGDFERSKAFYGKLLKFLGFKVLDEYEDAIGWTNGKTRLWIGPADTKGRKHKYRVGDIGFHHYAFDSGAAKMSTICKNFWRRRGHDRRSRRRILRRLLRRVLPRSGRHEIRGHEVGRAAGESRPRPGRPQTSRNQAERKGKPRNADRRP